MVMKNNVRFILSYENQEFRNTGYRNRRKASCALTYIFIFLIWVFLQECIYMYYHHLRC